jgi:DNA-binding NarL/FixJ family response regulator
VRAEPAPADVVIYTANPEPELDLLAREAGAYAVVEKGADVDELFDALRLAIRGRAAA